MIAEALLAEMRQWLTLAAEHERAGKFVRAEFCAQMAAQRLARALEQL